MILAMHGAAGGWDELAIAVVAFAVLWVAVKLAGRKAGDDDDDDEADDDTEAATETPTTASSAGQPEHAATARAADAQDRGDKVTALAAETLPQKHKDPVPPATPLG